MSASRKVEIERLQRICANCGGAFGFHGAVAPHQCPGEQISAGRWSEPTTHFKPESEERKRNG